MKKGITTKGQIYDFRSYIDVDLKKEIIEDISKNMEEIRQNFIENTGVPRNRLRIDLGNSEGDIGTETVWYGNKIIDSKIIKRDEKDS